MKSRNVGLGMVCLFTGMGLCSWAQSELKFGEAQAQVNVFKISQNHNNEITMEDWLATLSPDARHLFEKMMKDYLAVRRSECQRGVTHVPPKDLAYNEDWKEISMASRQFLEKSFDARFKVLGGCSWILSIK